MRSPFFLGLLVVLVSCETGTDDVNIRSHGFGLDDSSFEMNGPFELDSVQYSNAKSNYLLSGSIRYLKKEYSFTIVSKNSPKSESFEIEQFTFPLRSLDSSNFDCIFTYRKNVCEITWRNGVRFLYLKNAINEAN